MNELKHYGVLGMRWGRRKGTSNIAKVKKEKVKKGKLRLDTKKVLKGRTLADDILGDIGTLVAARAAGGLVAHTGSLTAGLVLSEIGTLYAVGSMAGSVISRVERDKK